MRSVRDRIVGCAFALVLTQLCGCGLVFIPRVQTFPGPVRAIRVVDASDGTDVLDAQVKCDLIRHSNWIHFPPQLFDPTTAPWLREPRYQSVRSLAVHREDNLFHVESCRAVGNMQWFFPLPLPLGWTLYRDHEALLFVRAPRYREIALMYAPDAPIWPGRQDRCDLECGACDYGDDGVLTFRLVKVPVAGQ